MVDQPCSPTLLTADDARVLDLPAVEGLQACLSPLQIGMLAGADACRSAGGRVALRRDGRLLCQRKGGGGCLRSDGNGNWAVDGRCLRVAASLNRPSPATALVGSACIDRR